MMRHHLESFDLLTDSVLPQIIEENNCLEVISKKFDMKHVIKMENMSICKPMFKEHDGTVHDVKANDGSCRKFTYSSAVLVDLVHEVYERVPESNVSESDPIKVTPIVSVAEKKNDDNEENEEDEENEEGDGFFTEAVPIGAGSTEGKRHTNADYNTMDFDEEEEHISNADVVEPTEKFRDILKECRVYKEVTLFHMPLMVGSRYCHAREQVRDVTCPYVAGGYFVVNGNEKVIIPREKLRTNTPYITVDGGKVTCEVRSWHESKMRSTSTLVLALTCIRGGSMPQILVTVPFINFKIPVAQVFRILNISNPQLMRRYILQQEDHERDHKYDHNIHSILKDDKAELSREDLMDFVGKKGTKDTTKEKRLRTIDNVFHTEFLPHMGLERSRETTHKKAIFFGMLILRMLQVYNGDREPDDRDDYANKHLETVHMLCALQFRQLLRNFRRTFQTNLQHAADTEKFIYVIDMMKNSKRITAGFKYALSTGKWGMSKGASTQTGVAQVLTRMNPLSTLSHLRRINTPINRDGKMTQPRQVHPSNWGLVCSHESPEGAPCGLIKNLALLCHVRLGYPIDPVQRLIAPQIVSLETAQSHELQVGHWVFINGRIVGVVDPHKAVAFVAWLRHKRQMQALPFDASIAHREELREIHISVDAGCCCRPVFVLQNIHKFNDIYETYKNQTDILWDMMVSEGVIEYLDKSEEFTLRVAVTWDDLKTPRRATEMVYTHIEIHPIVIMGLAVATLPFCHHDQAPRVTYGSVMSKQGVGCVGLNYDMRFDTSGTHMLWYPQRPIVSTFMSRVAGLDDIPFTINAIVAIGCYMGFNQEDSVILNKASVDRGLFRSFYYRTYKDTAKNVGADQEVFEVPDKSVVTGMKRGNYDKINPDDAMMDIGEQVEQDDVLIGKVMRTMEQNKRTDDDKIQKDRSVMYKSREKARIDKITTTMTKDGATMVNIRTRSMRRPETGDKFASRHGQKGVTSKLVNQEDMPCTRDGIVPDIIINPNALPSRMTISQIFETVLGKTSALAGHVGDGTPFQNLTHEQISEELKKFGFEKHGNERMFNGMTGELMEIPLFIGPCPYMRLKHMVVDKIHGRRTGPRQFLTHQPLEGRAREGGLRWGEMERDMLISHSAAEVVQDRLLNNSDYYETVVCTKCKMLAQMAPLKRSQYEKLLGKEAMPYCPRCESSDHIETVAMPCAFKVLMQNLEACHIRMRMELTDDESMDVVHQAKNGSLNVQ